MAKSGSRPRVTTRYVIHPVRMAPWVEGHNSGVSLEGLGEASRVVDGIMDFLAAEFPHKKVPHSEFEYKLGFHSWNIRTPLRNYVCFASERVAMILGLSRMMVLDWSRPVPEDFTAPACVIDSVTESLIYALSCELGNAQASRKSSGGEMIRSIISRTFDSAFNDAICAAVDKLDGIAPDCNREFIQFSVRGRGDTGPPDPFSSKSRFRNDLLQALNLVGTAKK